MGLEQIRICPAIKPSGAKQAQVLLARALAQAPPLLVADDPGIGQEAVSPTPMTGVFRPLANEGRAAPASLFWADTDHRQVLQPLEGME